MPIRIWRLMLCLGLITFLALASWAQNSDRINTIKDNLNNAKQVFDQMPDPVKKVAHSQRRLARLADAVNRMASRLAKVTPGQPWSDDRVNGGPDVNGLVSVTNPSRDFRFSPFAGYIQDETAIARCGDSVVVGFNDTGSVLETLANGARGISFTGVAASQDGGESFRDLGAVPPADNGTNIFNADILGGDPSVACSDSNNFYYTQNYFVFDPTIGNPANPAGGIVNEIALSSSHDGGRTWGDPVGVVLPARSDFGVPTDEFAFPTVAVDPSNHNRVYVAYTRVRVGDPLCGAVYTIEVEGSTDGGKSFGPPVIMDTSCFDDFDLLDVGTRLVVSSTGRVYVAWESVFRFPHTALLPQTVEVASFMPGSAPTAPVVVGTLSCTAFFNCISPVTAGIDGFLPVSVGETTGMQGEFLNLRDFDLAVDRSGGPTDGSVYVTWSAALGNVLAPEAADFSFDHFGFYAFTDIFISRSADGQNFSAPTQLNSDLQPLDSRGHDHFQPTLAVDKTGKVGACWYDRRNDPENFQFERFCAESKDAGGTWAEFRLNGTLSTPVTGQDLIALLDEMGLYDGLTSDFLGHAPGFIGSFQRTSSGMNPDIVAFGFR